LEEGRVAGELVQGMEVDGQDLKTVVLVHSVYRMRTLSIGSQDIKILVNEAISNKNRSWIDLAEEKILTITDDVLYGFINI
jgi:hypothetical protein